MGKEETKKDGRNDAGLRVLTPTARASYASLFKPKEYKGKTTYSVTLLFDKEDTDMSSLEAARDLAMTNTFGPNRKKWGTLDEDTGKYRWDNPIRDGDKPKFAKKEGYKGHWVVKASCGEDFKPTVVDRDGEEIIDSKELVSGDYIRAQIYAIAWETGTGGASFLLDGVQLVKKGKPLSARGATKFDPIGGGDSDEDQDDTSDNDSDDESVPNFL